MAFNGKREVFLSNISNKKRIIGLISKELVSSGCYVMQAYDDADVDIVKQAVRSSESQLTTLIGEDIIFYFVIILCQNQFKTTILLER